MIDKKRQLEELKNLEKEIKDKEDKNTKYWLFKTENGVQGFMGTGGKKQIMFVGERPSSEKKGVVAWKKFYGVLKDLDLQESHLTDLIKSIAKVGGSLPDDLFEDCRILSREIAIVKPRLIFTLGTKVHNHLLFYLAEKEIKAVEIYHYSYVFRRNKVTPKAYKKQIQDELKLL
jgi:uracil-DNA glycosylase